MSNLYFDYKVREEDDCYIYVYVYDENNKELYYRKLEHGKGRDKTYALYTININCDIDTLPSNKFKIVFKAENKWFKDFYVGEVKAKVLAIEEQKNNKEGIYENKM